MQISHHVNMTRKQKGNDKLVTRINYRYVNIPRCKQKRMADKSLGFAYLL